MALEEVPNYLVEGARATDPGRIADVLAFGDDQAADQVLEEAQQALAALANDDELWNSAAETLSAADQAPSLVDQLDAEHEVLTEALAGDRRLAASILIEVSLAGSDTDLEQAREVIVVIRNQCQAELERPKRSGRKWRVLKLAGRAFIAIGGGLAIAADIVVPDPTAILKIASIVGGAGTIVGAVQG